MVDGQWKLMFSHCMMQRKVQVICFTIVICRKRHVLISFSEYLPGIKRRIKSFIVLAFRSSIPSWNCYEQITFIIFILNIYREIFTECQI